MSSVYPVGDGCSCFARLSFQLCIFDALLLRSPCSRFDGKAPGGAICSKRLPGIMVDEEVFEIDLQVVLKALLLASNFAFPNSKFSIQELLRDTVVRHAGDVACPSQLGLANVGDDAGDACTLQDLCVRNFVLPANAEEVT